MVGVSVVARVLNKLINFRYTCSVNNAIEHHVEQINNICGNDRSIQTITYYLIVII